MTEDIIIIGAGASGLIAAKHLSDKGMNVLVLEADNRVGGRIHTVHDPSFPVPLEMGAEFIHGRLPLTLGLLKEAGIPYMEDLDGTIKIAGGKWTRDEDFIEGWDELLLKMKSVRTDMSLKSFLDAYYPDNDRLRSEVTLFAQGFDLADVNLVSVNSLVNEWSDNDHSQYRVPGGYKKLIDYLAERCRGNGCKILTGVPVSKIDWKKNHVKVISKSGRVYEARKLIITVPIGIIQAVITHTQTIQFNPEVSLLLKNARYIGFGSVVKYFTLFENFFSPELSKSSLIISDQQIPTWWVRFYKNDVMLTGWLGGPPASGQTAESIADYREQALNSLSGMFNVDKTELGNKLKAFRVVDWSRLSYSLGAYSYDMVGSKEVKRLLRKPLADTVYFAGEGLYEGSAPGTVEAALSTGKECALKLLSAWQFNEV